MLCKLLRVEGSWKFWIAKQPPKIGDSLQHIRFTDLGQMLIQRLVLLPPVAFIHSIHALFNALDGEDLESQLWAWKHLSKVDQLPKYVDSDQFLGTLTTPKQLASLAVKRLNPLATNERLDDPESVSTCQKPLRFVSNGAESGMLYFDQKPVGIDRIDTKTVDRYFDRVRIGCKMILQLTVERCFHCAVIAFSDPFGQDELGRTNRLAIRNYRLPKGR